MQKEVAAGDITRAKIPRDVFSTGCSPFWFGDGLRSPLPFKAILKAGASFQRKSGQKACSRGRSPCPPIDIETRAPLKPSPVKQAVPKRVTLFHRLRGHAQQAEKVLRVPAEAEEELLGLQSLGSNYIGQKGDVSTQGPFVGLGCN